MREAMMRLKVLLYTICAAAALLYKPIILSSETVHQFANMENPVGLFWAELRLSISYNEMRDAMLFLFLLSCIAHCYMKASTFKKESLVLALFFSLFMVIGKSMYYVGGLYLACLSSFAKLVMSIVSAFGYFILFIPVIDICIIRLFCCEHHDKLIGHNKWLDLIFEKHPILLTVILMVICELPYWVFFYPGTAMGDGIAQLTIYYGMNAMTNHHPIFSTLLMGMINDAGRLFGDNNFGLFCYTFFQSIVQIFAFSSVFVFAKKYKVPYGIRIAILTFFSLFSVWHVYGVTLVKDSAFYIAFLLFFLAMVDYWIQENDDWKIYLRIMVTGLAVWAFRNNGYYIVLISLFALLFKNLNKVRITKIIAISMLFIGINTVYHNVYMPFIGAVEGSVREMLSVPIQQTARCCKYYSDQMMEDDREILESMFSCTVEELGQNYNPQLSDPCKNVFMLTPTKDDLMRYFKVWFKQGMEHPFVYVDAFLNQCYGYLYPDRDVFDVISYYEIEGDVFFPKEMKQLQLHQMDAFIGVRHQIENIENIMAKLPVINYLYRCGTYTWVFLFFMMVLISKKLYRDCLMGIPLLATVGINCISPVNAYMRYQLPLMVAVPVFLLFVVYRCSSKENVSKGKGV